MILKEIEFEEVERILLTQASGRWRGLVNR